MSRFRITVFAKHLLAPLPQPIPNLAATHVYRKGRCAELEAGRFSLAITIYDGKTALRASEAARAAGLPLLLCFHGGFDTQAKIFDPRYREWTRQVAEEAAAVTVVCPADVVRLRAIGVRRPVDVVPVAVDCAMLPPRTQVELGSLLAIARLVPKKGIDTALRALALLPARYHLRIVGEGACAHALRELAATLGVVDRVTWLGMLPLRDALAELSRCEMLLHPARVADDGNADGTPQTVLMAQAIGVPVVTTLTGSLGDIVAHGETGILVPPDAPAALAAAVAQIGLNPASCEPLVRAAAAQVRERHDLPSVCAHVEAIYERIVHGPPLQ